MGIKDNKALSTYLETIINTNKMLIMHLLRPYKHILCLPILKWEQCEYKHYQSLNYVSINHFKQSQNGNYALINT